MGRLTGQMSELEISKIDVSESVQMMHKALAAMAGASEIPMLRATVAGGGAQVFDIKDQASAPNEIEGIILAYQYANVYWGAPMGEGDGIPECSSADGINGYTRDGENRSCRSCPLNRMGSADGSRGKACKNIARLMMLVEGEAFPIDVKVPTMSLKNFSQYLGFELTPRGLTANQVITRLTVEQIAKSKTVKYGRIKFECTGRLDDQACAGVQSLIGEVKPMLAIEESTQHEEETVNG